MKYGESKMRMEILANEYFSSGKMNIVIIRPPWFYGPYQPSRQIKFYKMIKDGLVPLVGDGTNVRSMAHTTNIAQGLIRSAIEDKANGQTYWIADKVPYSFNKIIDTIRKVMENEFKMNCKSSKINLPNIASFMAYQLDTLIQNFGLYNKEIHVLSEMNKNIACSIDKAVSEINYHPTYDLYEGTKLSIAEAISRF